MMRISCLTLLVVAVACGGDSDPASGIAAGGQGGQGAQGGSQGGGDQGGGGQGGGGQAGGVPCDATDPLDCAYTPEHDLGEDSTTVDASVPSLVPGRDLNIRVRWAPGDIGPRPLVFWAHGGSYNTQGHLTGASWSRVFARAGYVVIHPAAMPLTPSQLQAVCQQLSITDPAECDDYRLYEHYGLTDVSCNDDATCLAECDYAPSGCRCDQTSNKCAPPEGDSPLTAIGFVRPHDIAALVAALPTIATQMQNNAGIEIDVDTVAVGGWSGGTQAVVQSAGAIRALSVSVPAFTAEVTEPLAFLNMSPQGPGFSGFFAGPQGSSWDPIARPTLVLTGDGDEKATNELTGPDRREVYENLPAGDKHLLYSTLDSPLVGHSTFDLDDWDPDTATELDGLHAALRSVALAFLDHHLRGSDAGADYLATDSPVRLVEGEVDFESK